MWQELPGHLTYENRFFTNRAFDTLNHLQSNGHASSKLYFSELFLSYPKWCGFCIIFTPVRSSPEAKIKRWPLSREGVNAFLTDHSIFINIFMVIGKSFSPTCSLEVRAKHGLGCHECFYFRLRQGNFWNPQYSLPCPVISNFRLK